MRLADRLAASGCVGVRAAGDYQDARALLLVCSALVLKINEGVRLRQEHLHDIGEHRGFAGAKNVDFVMMERKILEALDYDLVSCEDDDIKAKFAGHSMRDALLVFSEGL